MCNIYFHSTNGCFSLISFNKSTFDTQPSPIKASYVYSFIFAYSSYSSFVKSSKDIFSCYFLYFVYILSVNSNIPSK